MLKKSAGFRTVFVLEVFTAVHTQNAFFEKTLSSLVKECSKSDSELCDS